MKKVHLFGRHSHRTPMSYPDYRSLFDRHFEFVDDPLSADLVVSGFRKDFLDNANQIAAIQRSNPKIRFVVLSEEPLWDTVWSDSPLELNATAKLETTEGPRTLSYTFINHLTSSIYEFERIPYFITTTNDFFLRYLNLFQRNAKLTKKALLDTWHNASIDCAFIAAKRPEPSFDVSFAGGKVLGLNRFRTLVAEAVSLPRVLREGEGWVSGHPKRQALPDWHLDKLAALDRSARIVSALENTHLDTYISEKLFDAFAVLAVPIYHALPGHRANGLIAQNSLINAAGLSVKDASQKIASFKPDDVFLDAYMDTQRRLRDLFSNPKVLYWERQRVVAAVVNQLKLVQP